MKKVSIAILISSLTLTVVAVPVNDFCKITLKETAITSVSTVWVRDSRELSVGRGEYPLNYSFPTNDMLYWKQSGNNIVAMSPAEQSVVNSNVQQTVTVATTGDAQMDSLLRTIAECTRGGTKTYAEVVAIFKSQVDPVKAKKEKSK